MLARLFPFFISKVIYLGQYPLCLFIAFYFFFHKVFPIEKLRTKHSCAIEKKTKKKSTNVATAKAGFSWIWQWIQATSLYCLYLCFLSFIAFSSQRQLDKISAHLTTFITSEPSVPPARRDRSSLELLAASCQLKASLFLRVSGSLVLGERALSCTVSALDSARGDALRWKSHV